MVVFSLDHTEVIDVKDISGDISGRPEVMKDLRKTK